MKEAKRSDNGNSEQPKPETSARSRAYYRLLGAHAGGRGDLGRRLESSEKNSLRCKSQEFPKSESKTSETIAVTTVSTWTGCRSSALLTIDNPKKFRYRDLYDLIWDIFNLEDLQIDGMKIEANVQSSMSMGDIFCLYNNRTNVWQKIVVEPSGFRVLEQKTVE
jgi:hypothetical protein